MTFAVPTVSLSSLRAKDSIEVANQFMRDEVQRYVGMYETFWYIGRDDVDMVEMQAVLDAMGMSGIQVLTQAVGHVAYLKTTFDEVAFPAKYWTAPYSYVVEAGPRIVLTELLPAWLPPVPEPTPEAIPE